MRNKNHSNETLKKLFSTNSPFPHVVIDDFLEKDAFNKLQTEFNNFYESNKKDGKTYTSDVEKDKWSSQGLSLTPYLKKVGEYLASEENRNWLTKITGFKNLSAVDDFNHKAIGFFSLMKKGSYLGPHIDHMYDMTGDKGYHVLNIILYVSDKWNPNWGGNTTLKNRKTKNYASVEFKPNRALVFMHSPISEHGTSLLSKFSESNRMTIYFDYYSSNKNPYAHTNYNFRLVKSPHIFFLPNFIDYLKPKNRKYLKLMLSHFKHQLISYFK